VPALPPACCQLLRQQSMSDVHNVHPSALSFRRIDQPAPPDVCLHEINSSCMQSPSPAEQRPARHLSTRCHPTCRLPSPAHTRVNQALLSPASSHAHTGRHQLCTVAVIKGPGQRQENKLKLEVTVGVL
jgi:hypothetical protein